MPRHPLYIQVHILVYIRIHQQQPVHYMILHMVYLVAGTLPTYKNILDIERVTHAYDVCMMMQRPCSSSILYNYDISSNNNNNIPKICCATPYGIITNDDQSRGAS